MDRRKLINIATTMLLLVSTLVWEAGPVLAADPMAGGSSAGGAVLPLGGVMTRMTNAEREAAAKRAAANRAAAAKSNAPNGVTRAAALAVPTPGGTPDYFGIYPNYANSPQAMMDVAVNITGGGGALAAATATVGGVTGITLTGGGGGYLSAPTVTISGGGGYGATATASVSGGAVTALILTGSGSGFTSAPTVSFSGGAGFGASAAATVAPGVVTDITLIDGGAGYTSAPAVSITSGTGTGATATAKVAGITGLTLNSSGSGYTSVPTVSITGGGGAGATATATIASGFVTSLVLTNSGSGYTIDPTVTISGGGGTGATATSEIAPGIVTSVTLTAGGSGYTLKKDTRNIVTGIVVTSRGSGYTSAPAVAIAGTGTGATATAAVANGIVTGIWLTNAGTGYTIAPTVTLTGGGGTGATATATVANGNNVGIRKFVDSLPGLTAAGANDLGQYIPVAIPDTTRYPGSDYYEISLVEYSEQLHKDLPPTKLRGYMQTNTTNPTVKVPSYLGPLIVAQTNRPVRVKFTNKLPIGVGGDLFIPVDTTVMGAGTGPLGGTEKYTENRATLHLHGGDTVWISDGTPHQWVTPAGETTSYPKGVSVEYVPDMDGGTEPPGTMTFFYSNQQSARLMFYHDHAYGITRLNVYAGEAAGYLLSDATEKGLVSTGIIPSTQIPLVIQDKTFVPGPAELAAEDPTWDTAKYGGLGNLWYPHVYMPNQNPFDIAGANAMGRWDYGPWFWPPYTGLQYGPVANPYYGQPNEPPQIPGVPNVSLTPEAFMDTPVVNGVAYPYLPVGQKAYRFRILNACNDRFLNLQLYYAASNGTMWDLSGNLIDPNAGEVKMVQAVPGAGLPATWPTDGREGGVPDPRSVGPSMIQIGTEGGILPAPAVLPNTPVGYDYDRRSITVLNVQATTLFLGPAERADIIIDFSKVPNGAKLILYNDAPAPVPAFDTRLDYYTGDPDQTATGGAPTTLPGYGPNTRTIMQFQVSSALGTAAAYNLNALKAALPSAFAVSQPKIIVPQSAYNAAYKKTYPADAYVRIADTSMRFFNGPLTGVTVTNGGTGYTSIPTVSISGGGGTGATAIATMNGVVGLTLTSGGTGYTTAPTVSLTGGGGTGATAIATIAAGAVSSVTIVNRGSGYTTAPTIGFSGGGGTGASATAVLAPGTVTGITLTSGGTNYISAPTVTISGGGGSGATALAIGVVVQLKPKAIQELFTVDYGRMNATLGVELPNTNFTIQTTIPYGYIDPPTEFLNNSALASPIGSAADGTQIWKITHNGVDTHAVHFHLFNVQVLNRVGWDGMIKWPDANELGWKDTVRMNPLEDIIVALRPTSQSSLPFKVPDSIRALDVTNPIGSTMGFFNVDPNGNPVTITNQLTNFGWEYVWHCHLLGHEENDMMRPMVFQVSPAAPSGLTATNTLAPAPNSITLNWTNNAVNPAATRFLIQRATNAGFTTGLRTFAVNVPATTYIDNSVTTTTYYYRVRAENTLSYSTWSNTATLTTRTAAAMAPAAAPPVRTSPVSSPSPAVAPSPSVTPSAIPITTPPVIAASPTPVISPATASVTISTPLP